MVQKTVLKVNVSCEKCKQKLLKAVTGLQGVDKVEVDTAKGTLSVTGDADPYKIVGRVKKTKKFVEIVTIGPPPPPPKPADPKKPEEPKKPSDYKPELHAHFYAYHSCAVCDGGYGPSCTIL